MGVERSIDITAEQRETILALLRRHLPGTAAWVYGSRATWTSRPQSDLDLVVFATPEQVRCVGDLRQAFEESNLPFRVDLFVWNDIPESFLEQIERDHVVLSQDKNCSPRGSQWRLAKVEDISEKVAMGPFGSSIKVSTFVPHGVPIISGQHLHRFRVDDSPGFNFISTDHAMRLANSNVKRGDVIFTHAGNIEHVAYIPENSMFDNYVVSQRQFYMRCDCSKVLPEFVVLYFKSPEGQHKLLANSSQVGVPAIAQPVSYLRSVEFPVPPIGEQRAIVHILGTLEDKIELNRRMNETLEAMARALFKSWFVDFDPVRAKMEGRESGLPQPLADLFPDRLVDSAIGEIPEGWEAAPLGDLIDLNPKRMLRKGQVASYLGMANMPTKGHVPDKWVDRPFGSGMRFVNGDTLLARITPCLENGKTAYVDFLPNGSIGWGSTEYIVMRPKPPIPSEFAYYLARSPDFREYAIHNMTGTSGRQRVPAKALAHFPLVAPSKEIGEAFGNLIQPLFANATANARESRTLTTFRDSLLPKLISGEVRVAENKGELEAFT